MRGKTLSTHIYKAPKKSEQCTNYFIDRYTFTPTASIASQLHTQNTAAAISPLPPTPTIFQFIPRRSAKFSPQIANFLRNSNEKHRKFRHIIMFSNGSGIYMIQDDLQYNRFYSCSSTHLTIYGVMN